MSTIRSYAKVLEIALDTSYSMHTSSARGLSTWERGVGVPGRGDTSYSMHTSSARFETDVRQDDKTKWWTDDEQNGGQMTNKMVDI